MSLLPSDTSIWFKNRVSSYIITMRPHNIFGHWLQNLKILDLWILKYIDTQVPFIKCVCVWERERMWVWVESTGSLTYAFKLCIHYFIMNCLSSPSSDIWFLKLSSHGGCLFTFESLVCGPIVGWLMRNHWSVFLLCCVFGVLSLMSQRCSI